MFFIDAEEWLKKLLFAASQIVALKRRAGCITPCEETTMVSSSLLVRVNLLLVVGRGDSTANTMLFVY